MVISCGPYQFFSPACSDVISNKEMLENALNLDRSGLYVVPSADITKEISKLRAADLVGRYGNGTLFFCKICV